MAPTLKTNTLAAGQLAAALLALRARTPLVHCLTNTVVAGLTANVLLAAGAAPAMTDNAAEAAGFAARAGAVLVNLGTPYADTTQAMSCAIIGAQDAGVPWVLDPVGGGALPWRTALARAWLADGRPAIVRGNASEILGLAGGAGGKGVDSTAAADDALTAAVELARRQRCVVAVSGAVDLITDGARLARMGNGSPLLTRVSGTGCALGALMAALAAVEPDALVAASAATALLTVAAERAAQHSAGPGSFAVALIDALYALQPDALAASTRFV